ncbi:MAG TPA: CHAT domain-containing protein, partial [Gemmatimonas sp.]|nr:CHAT domain-containing protein [Gemmatimonas sp.]
GLRHPLRYAPSFAALRAMSAPSSTSEVDASASGTTAKNAQNRRTSSTAAPARASRPSNAMLAQALVVGNPTMPTVYSGRSNTRAQLRPLPGAEDESRTVARLLGASVVTGKAATETMVRNRIANAPLIHFATHGLGYGSQTAARRSYVAFAPDSAQDGLLTLGELMDDRTLTLRAELVVLSACQTGVGDLKRAEGSIGLQRAFIAKGAKSVLVSLWSVDDRATQLLMEKFYAYWLDPVNPRSKAEALQLAQDAVRRTPRFSHPRYWAAFQLVGGS